MQIAKSMRLEYFQLPLRASAIKLTTADVRAIPVSKIVRVLAHFLKFRSPHETLISSTARAELNTPTAIITAALPRCPLLHRTSPAPVKPSNAPATAKIPHSEVRIATSVTPRGRSI